MTKKDIPLYWFKKGGKYGNFGDELGPYLIQCLSGQQIYRIPIPRSSVKLIFSYLKGLFTGHYSLSIFIRVLKTLFLNGRYIVSIGSIIGWGSGPRIVWGSGVLVANQKIDNGKFLAVRGKYTQQRLTELGYECPSVFGDPALLLPLIYNPKIEKNHKIGLIPHHTQFEHFSRYEQLHKIKVINLIGDIHSIINEILSCDTIISSSLHGLIVPHSYDIPAIWYHYPKIDIHGEDIKFLDYFSSVGIKEYEPYLLPEIEHFDTKKEYENIQRNIEMGRINVDLNVLQQSLLKAAPFPVRERFLHPL